jgi:hypothetical protein
MDLDCFNPATAAALAAVLFLTLGNTLTRKILKLQSMMLLPARALTGLKRAACV